MRGRVQRVSLNAPAGRWAVEVSGASGPAEYHCPAFMLTGPGIHRPISHHPDAASHIFHCDSRRVEFARIPKDRKCEIAIIGGGESALSSLALLRRSRRQAIFTVYTPNLPMSRAESFLENRVFSNPNHVDWGSLSLETRRDFIKHGDRGVFDPQTLSEIAYDENCRFVVGRVNHVSPTGRSGRVSVEHSSPEGPTVSEHDYVVNCTGFDLLEQLRALLPAEAREEVERQVGPLWSGPPELELPIGRHLELRGMCPRLHVPGLAGLSQGPGFANLGSLGVLANRVLGPFFRGEAGSENSHESELGDTAASAPAVVADAHDTVGNLSFE